MIVYVSRQEALRQCPRCNATVLPSLVEPLDSLVLTEAGYRLSYVCTGCDYRWYENRRKP